jgi:hypothetical protein
LGTVVVPFVPEMVPGGRAGLVVVMGASGIIIAADVVHRVLEALR